MRATGHCLCGAVTFTAEDVETDVHGCHCRTCSRWNGGPALAVGVGKITYEGEQNITRFESSAWAERGFCKLCGSNLFFRLKEADHYIVMMGSFDDLLPYKLSGEIFIDEKPPGYGLAGDHPRLTGEEFMASLQNE